MSLTYAAACVPVLLAGGANALPAGHAACAAGKRAEFRCFGADVWLAVVMMLVSGCELASRVEEVEPQRVAILDSAGTRIVISPSAVAFAEVGWTVHQPNLKIGALMNADPEYELHRIRGVRQLEDGTIVVLNGGTKQLRYYSSDGAFAGAIGRDGSGPGEFRGMPQLVRSAISDTLMVFDPGLQRFSTFSPYGVHYASFPYVSTSRTLFRAPWGAEIPVTRISVAVGRVRDRVVTEHTVGVFTERAGILDEPRQFRIVDPITGVDTVLADYVNRSWFVTSADELGQTARLRTPFSISPTATVGHGTIVIIPPQGREVRVHDADGRLTQIMRTDEPAAPPNQADLQALIDRLAADAPSAAAASMFRREYQRVSLPSQIPLFDRMVVDALQYVWVRLYERGDGVVDPWVVFDSSGIAKGIVYLPSNLSVEQIGIDFVLGVWRDEWNVESVRRYHLSRN